MASTTSDNSASSGRWRAAQRGLTRLLLRDLLALRRLLDPGRLQATVPPWIDAVTEVVAGYSETSATLAADFYDGEREAAGVPGTFTVPLADPPPDEQVDASLRWATKDLWPREEADATVAQLEPLDVRIDAAMKKADAATQKLVADAGRDTLRQAVRSDPQAVAYARTAALGACSFCKLMASRGSVYRTAGSAGRDANDRFSGDASVVKFHDNCVPAGTLVDGPAAEVGYRRWYEGEMLVIGTAAGHQLSITPNHPVLTDRGWIPAGLLRPGDHVLSSLNTQGSLLQIPHEEHVPARIEDVWSALRVLGLVSVPVTPEDFHGDGSDGEVDVVRSDGLLRQHGETPALQVLTEVELALAGMRQGLFAPLSSPEQFFGGNVAPSGRLVSSRCKAQALLAAQLGHTVGHGLSPISDWGSNLKQGSPYGVSADLMPFGERLFTLAIQVGGSDIRQGQVELPSSSWNAALPELTRQYGRRHAASISHLGASHACLVETDRAIKVGYVGAVGAGRFDPPGLYGAMDGPDAYARLGRDLRERLSGRVERDRVVDVRRTEFAGHVYNLQTEQGWYRADGVIVSNCHCGIIPVFRGQRFELSPHAAEWDRIYLEYAQGHPGDQLRLFRRALAEHDANPLPGSN